MILNDKNEKKILNICSKKISLIFSEKEVNEKEEKFFSNKFLFNKIKILKKKIKPETSILSYEKLDRINHIVNFTTNLKSIKKETLIPISLPTKMTELSLFIEDFYHWKDGILDSRRGTASKIKFFKILAEEKILQLQDEIVRTRLIAKEIIFIKERSKEREELMRKYIIEIPEDIERLNLLILDLICKGENYKEENNEDLRIFQERAISKLSEEFKFSDEMIEFNNIKI